MLIGLNKTTQKHGCRMRKIKRERVKIYILKQMNFSVKDKIAIAMKYFGLRTSAAWRLRNVNIFLRMSK
jgi:hypothetical protein